MCIFVCAHTQVKRKHKNTTIISMMEARRKVCLCSPVLTLISTPFPSSLFRAAPCAPSFAAYSFALRSHLHTNACNTCTHTHMRTMRRLHSHKRAHAHLLSGPALTSPNSGSSPRTTINENSLAAEVFCHGRVRMQMLRSNIKTSIFSGMN